MEYDEGGRVIKECFSGGLPGDKGTTVENIYDDLGNRIETRTSLGSVVQNSFDEDGLLSRVTASGGGVENWEEKIVRDSEGLKIEKIFSGGIRMTRTYDAYGNVISQKSRSFRQDGYDRRYAWNASGRLQSVIDGITGGRTTYAYDAVGSLMSARYEDGTDDYRMPDATGNVFRSRDRRDREYGKGGRILRDRHYDYLYDVEGNLILKTPRRGLTQHPNHEVSEESGTHIAWQTGDYAYEWYGNGMLKEVRLPYGKTIRFEYDALGRRTAKLFNGHVFRYLWDGNVMVQEWQYEEKDRPQHSIDEFGRIRMQSEEPVYNLVTWVYEEGSYVPVAKIQNGERYTIISDYMGRPVEAYNSYGNVVWQADYDIYGDLRNIKGIRDFIPFRQLGQYEDDETRLYYNRFRYYDPRIGNYISQDPIRLAGNNPTLYGYVGDLNKWADLFGLYDTVIFSKDEVIKQVTIKMQGSRDWDFREANKKSKILGKRGKATINAHREVYGEVTWHHATYNPDDNTAVMQLVKRADHEASLPHEGSVSQFEQKTGFKYESDEAKDAAKKLNSKDTGIKIKCKS